MPPPKNLSQLSRHLAFKNLLLTKLCSVPQLLHPPCVPCTHSCIYFFTMAYITNPKPLHPLVFGFLITTVSVPHCSKRLLRFSPILSEVSTPPPPHEELGSCSPSLGDSDLDTMAGRWEPSAMLPYRVHRQKGESSGMCGASELELMFWEEWWFPPAPDQNPPSPDVSLRSALPGPTLRSANVLLQLPREVVFSVPVPGSHPAFCYCYLDIGLCHWSSIFKERNWLLHLNFFFLTLRM